MEDERGYHYPAVTTDIAIFARARESVEILLIRRKNPPYQGAWALPGGFLDKDETAETCAARELEEETGVSAEGLELVGVYSEPERDPRGRTVTLAYAAMVDAGSIRPEARDDAAEVGWFDIGDLPALAFDHDRIIADAIAMMQDRF